MENLQIKDIRIYSAVSKISRPIADSTHDISKIAFYVTEVETVGGTIGQSNVLSFHYSPNAIQGALKDLKETVLSRGYCVNESKRMRREIEIEHEYFGIPGIQRWALAALNTACWDAYARALSQPIWKLLGGSKKAIPVYGSGGWLNYTDEELLEEVLDYKKRGFTAVKIKVGSPDPERYIRRLNRCREELGC